MACFAILIYISMFLTVFKKSELIYFDICKHKTN